MARLSTHVLDTTRGKPASKLAVDLYKFDSEGGRELLVSMVTNADGRTEEPLLSADSLTPGIYELLFHAGDYFRSRKVTLNDPPFLDEIVIRFGISDSAGNYHVPLLLSTYGYSTYRGS